MIAVDFNTSLYHGHSYSDYLERYPDATDYVTDVNTSIIDHNQVYAIAADYNWKNWQFEAGVIMPLGKYDQGSKSLSHCNRNEQHTRLYMRIPYMAFSYNLQWGRQKRRSGKLVNADASVDHSTTGGR